ncbi:hypothetical protein [Prauserella cavernicola]|uniref:Uncharacterized protein n=1 Tax=Prauserella cavernicola TaxID=2800127 RepID=A0A934QRW2_9PSEU|nr:hypothetical protein [Prauserella cavernicola]MBK1785147.1 hypothetical protein [Prauserella cavernicola]
MGLSRTPDQETTLTDQHDADEARTFSLYMVLAVTHGLPSYGSHYRDILEFMSGETLPSPSSSLGVTEPCREWLHEQHPRLRDVPPRPDFGDDEQAMDAWAAEQATRLGTTHLPVRPLPADRRDFTTPLKRIVAALDD